MLNGAGDMVGERTSISGIPIRPLWNFRGRPSSRFRMRTSPGSGETRSSNAAGGVSVTRVVTMILHVLGASSLSNKAPGEEGENLVACCDGWLSCFVDQVGCNHAVGALNAYRGKRWDVGVGRAVR